jgi:hypothetical protein
MDEKQMTMIMTITLWSSLLLAGGDERQAKRRKYAAQMMLTTTTKTTTMEKMTTKKSILNLLSTHPRAEKAPEPIPHASWE